MFKMIRFVYILLRECGLNLKKIRNLSYFPRYFKTYLKYRKLGRIDSLFPCITDFKEQGGINKGHYFHQDLLVAQKIFNKKPKKHLDIGSRMDGFVTHVASYRKLDVMDIRRVESNIKNVNFVQGDLTLIGKGFEKYDSISCLHTLEHIGLGRYGDMVNPKAHLLAIKNLKKMLLKNGTLYVSMPISRKERTEFNAHRIFKIKTILEFFKDLRLISFHYVDDAGNLHEEDISNIDLKSDYNLNFGCGIFEFKKQ